MSGQQGTDSATSDPRFTRPLYTVKDAALYLGVPQSTMGDWARGYAKQLPDRPEVVSGPVITAAQSSGKGPRIPFIGLAEGLVAAAFRQAGVSLQHIRRAVEILEEEVGLEHAMASRRLYTDGAKVLYDYSEHGEHELSKLTVVINRQGVFGDVVERYLERITYDEEGWAERLRLPITEHPVLEVDPKRAFGEPVFMKGGARMKDVLDRFLAGDSIQEVALDYEVGLSDVEEVVRAALEHTA